MERIKRRPVYYSEGMDLSYMEAVERYLRTMDTSQPASPEVRCFFNDIFFHFVACTLKKRMKCQTMPSEMRNIHVE